MAQSSFPFENIDTTETQYSQLFRTLNNGVNGTPDGGELEVDAAGAGLAVDIAAGQGMVRGHFYASTEIETRTLAVADSTNDRLDLVILRLDPVANNILLAVKTGVPDPAPVAPSLVQTDGGIFEQPLAEVLVPANAGIPGTITDRREFMGTRLGTWTTAGRPLDTGRVLFGFNTTTERIEFYNTITEAWEEVTPASIGDIGDVTLTSPSYGQVLSYNPAGSNFINNANNNPVMVFDDSAARGSAIPTPAEGMVTYLKDTNQVSAFNGSAFAPLGTILQVVSTTLTTAFSSASTSFTTVTGLTVSITPSSASSKILVTASVGAGGNSSNAQAMHLRLSGGNTASYVGAADGSKVQGVFSSLERGGDYRPGGGAVMPLSLVFLDSPATTSSITYSVDGRTDNGGTFFVNRVALEANNASFARTASTITVMEVAG